MNNKTSIEARLSASRHGGVEQAHADTGDRDRLRRSGSERRLSIRSTSVDVPLRPRESRVLGLAARRVAACGKSAFDRSWPVSDRRPPDVARSAGTYRRWSR